MSLPVGRLTNGHIRLGNIYHAPKGNTRYAKLLINGSGTELSIWNGTASGVVKITFLAASPISIVTS